MLSSESHVSTGTDTMSPIRAMHSLRESHARALAAALAGFPGMCSFERHECYDGNLILMLTWQAQKTESLVVTRDGNGFYLSSSQDDRYRKLGCFGTMNEVIATIRASMRTEMVGLAGTAFRVR